MPRRNKGSVPSLVHHKPSGRARVRINGRDHWLGKWGAPEAQLAYNRLIAEYLATGQVGSPRLEPAAEVVVGAKRPSIARRMASANDEPNPGGLIPETLTVAELGTLYLDYCQTWYRDPSGRQTSTYGNALQAIRALRPFDDTLASSFGPKNAVRRQALRLSTLGA